MNARTEIAAMSAHINTLTAFFDKYDCWDKFVCMHPIGGNAAEKPKLTYYNEDKSWCIATFGAEGWFSQSNDCGDGWLSYEKTVDGIDVSMYRAARVEPYVRKPVPVNLVCTETRELAGA